MLKEHGSFDRYMEKTLSTEAWVARQVYGRIAPNLAVRPN